VKTNKDEALEARLEHQPCLKADLAYDDHVLRAHGPHEHWMDMTGEGEILYWCEGLKAHPLTQIGRRP
jgi:hypothetical protein